MKWKHAIVVGGSSGIGAELVRLLVADGCRVACVARRTCPIDEALSFQHDVRNAQEVPSLFQKITGELGGLDLVIYAAGVMPRIGLEEFDTAKDLEILETNFAGAVVWLNQAAIRFKNVGSGTIVGIGSVAGERGRRGQPVYNSSKGAVATYLEALRNRLHGRGVTVVTIKPGPVETEMTAGLELKGAMNKTEAARKILRLSSRAGEHYLKVAHRLAFGVIRHIPGSIFRRLKI